MRPIICVSFAFNENSGVRVTQLHARECPEFTKILHSIRTLFVGMSIYKPNCLQSFCQYGITHYFNPSQVIGIVIVIGMSSSGLSVDPVK